jgi:hypothetical protein
MSELDKIKDKPKAKRKLSKIRFDFEGAEASYTDASQGGACSEMNEPFLLKAKEVKPLTEGQKAILQKIGEEPTPLGKSLSDKDNNVSKQKEDDKNMSENMVTREEFENLQKALAVAESTNSILKYGFEAEMNKSVADALANLDKESREAIVKAFDKMTEEKEEAINKAKEKSTEKSTLEQELEKEAGESGEAEGENVEKSLVERIQAYQKKKEGESN